MNRRTFISSGSLALAGYAIGGCATTDPSRAARSAPRRPPINLAPVHVSFDRVIRTTVGLRPHRDSGFVLRAEKLDAKTLIHNYGHAGAGHVAGVGLRRDGGRVRAGDGSAPRRRDRLRIAGPDDRQAAAAARVRGHDLRRDGAAGHDVEHVAGRIHADHGADRQRPAHAGLGRAVSPRGGAVVRAAAADGRPDLRRLLDGQLQRHRRPGSDRPRRRRPRR